MRTAPCILWQEPDPTAGERLPGLIEKSLARGSGACRVFFRADDIALIDTQFVDLIKLFKGRKVPLGLALVPKWLDQKWWDRILALCGDSGLWTWHQHGYAHLNYQTRGKNYEFGPARSPEEKERDLARGWEHLASLAGKRLSPIFTPPWNRVDLETLQALKRLGFAAISRSLRPKIPPLPGLMELPVAVDPHTRNEPGPAQAYAALETQLGEALASGLCGIMLHHQLMNRAAFEWLDDLITALARVPGVELTGMSDLLAQQN